MTEQHNAQGAIFFPSPFLDRFLADLIVPCAYKVQGCSATVAFHSHSSHIASCAFRPTGNLFVPPSTLDCTVDSSLISCAACHSFLEPPFFSCSSGHALCSACGSVLLFANQGCSCKPCVACGFIAPFTVLSQMPILDGFKIPCRYPDCGALVPCFAMRKHKDENGH